MERPERNFAQKIADVLIFAGIRFVASVLGLLGPRAGYGLCAFSGRVWLWLFPKRRRIAHRNLEIAFPGRLGAAEKDRITLSCCQHALANLIEMLVRDRALGGRDWQEFVELEAGLVDALRAEYPGGQAILSAHIGSWEMGQYFAGLAGCAFTSIVRSLDNPYLDRDMVRLRGCFGQGVIRKVGALRGILGLLKRGGRVGIMADQNCPRRESFQDFFGLTAATYSDYAQILVRQECPVFFLACVRDGLRFRFRIWSRRLEVPAEGTRNERADVLVKNYLRAIEDVAREHPEQYLWVHKRWKSRPEGEPSPYDEL